MKILIVGNGFDLEHSLPTKYWDFLKFVNKFQKLSNLSKDNLRAIMESEEMNKNVQEYLLNDEIFNNENHSELLQELSSLISNNIWLKQFDNKKDIQNKGWIDFEYEISKVIQCLDYYMGCNENDLKQPNQGEIRQDNEKYQNGSRFITSITKVKGENHNSKFKGSTFHGDIAKEIIRRLVVNLDNLIRCLEIYLEECVEKIKVEYNAPDIIKIGKIDKLISFNYTNTYQRVYGKGDTSIEYDYIHGKLDTSKCIEENNMVLGIDEYLGDSEKNKNLEFIQFKKYFQRIYKKTGCKYKEWEAERRQAKVDWKDNANTEIFIFGHSLDVTDKDILSELITSENCKTTIFYYNKEDYATKISNLVKIIGQDVLIASVYGSDPSIIFKQQQSRIKV